MGKILATLLFVLVSCGVQAQRSTDAAVTFKNLITNFYVDEVSGNVIVRKGGAVKCYNPQTDSIVWRVKKEDLPHGNARQFHVSNAEEKGKPYDANEHIWGIPETPYIETRVGGITAIIDITNGNTVLAASELPFDAAHVSYLVDDDLFIELGKIRLEDGAKMGSIRIGDNAPIYTIDPETDDVYAPWTTNCRFTATGVRKNDVLS